MVACLWRSQHERRGRAVHRIGIRARGDGDTGGLRQLQYRPRQDLNCSGCEGDEVMFDEEDEGDNEGDGDYLSNTP